MKMKTLLISATILCGFAGSAIAQPMMPPKDGGHFDMVDANKDGFLTREEVKAAHLKKFTQMDVNKDGALTKDEMKSHHKSQMEMMKSKMIEKRVSHLDLNKDGSISKDEWLSGPERAKKIAAEMHAKRFDQIDTNKDGKLSDAELAAVKPMHDMKHKKGNIKEVRVKDGVMKHHGPNPDANNDGKITKAEWEAMPTPLFDHGDINKDGKISREEAQTAMKPKEMHGGFKPR